MNPDPVTVLTTLGLGHYAAAIVVLLACAGYGITWLAPLIPPPSPNAGGWAKFAYAVINKIAGNMHHATNATDPKLTSSATSK